MDEEDDVDIEGDFSFSASMAADEVAQPPSSYLLPEYSQHPWTLDEPWDTDMDAKSKEVIGKLLIDEGNAPRGNKKASEKVSMSKAKTSELAMYKTSRQRLWTSEEKALFETGLDIYGPSWKDIAELIPGRTYEHVRNYANRLRRKSSKQIMKKQKPSKHHPGHDLPVNVPMERGEAKRDIKVEKHSTNYTIEHQTNNGAVDGDDSDTDIDIESDSDDQVKSTENSVDEVYLKLLENVQASDHSNCVLQETTTATAMMTTATAATTNSAATENTLDIGDPEKQASAEKSFFVKDNKEEQPLFTDANIAGKITQDIDRVFDSAPRMVPEYGVLNSNGELVKIDPPDKACEIDKTGISQLERNVHFEFFDERHNKTPERYIKIRNFILEQWEKVKPEYLNKTSIRNGLKNCGDVNCIGRIHALLEQLGAINFGCEQVVYCRLPMTTRVGRSRPVKSESRDGRLPEIRQRKRRTATHPVFPEGVTIEHGSDDDEQQVIPRKMKQREKLDSDRFKLMQCKDFIDSELGAPYRVVLESTAAIIMDVHAHICNTEVIGMLGGRFESESGCLRVVRAEPCSSNSTNMQCEMDPVSQTRAGQIIQDAGLHVVGWYHSHPIFVPDPSLQDIESQDKFQRWFAQGGDHFLGIIISPYNVHSQSVQSEIRCFTTQAKMIARPGSSITLSNKVPFKFPYTVETSADNPELPVVVMKVKRLLEMYAHYEHCVDMLDSYRSSSELTSLEKMLQSVESYFKYSKEAVPSALILEDIRCVVTSMFERGN